MKDFDLHWDGDKLIEELERRHANLLSPAFVSRHTRFSDLGAMVEAGREHGIDVSDLDTSEWSAFVAEHSDFEDWTSMLNAALAEGG